MKISIISSYLPSLTSGSQVRIYHLLKNLSTSSEVRLFCAVPSSSEHYFNRFREEVHKNTYPFTLPEITLPDRILYYAQNKIPYVERLRNSGFGDILDLIPQDTDIIQITELFGYFIVEPYLNMLPGLKVLDAHNIDHLRLKSEFDDSPFWRRILGLPIFYNLKKYEIDAVRRVDYVLTCSEEDKKIFSQYKNPRRIMVVPNGVENSFFSYPKTDERKHSVLFMGLLSYSPNNNGLKWYIDTIHPAICRKYTDYQLTIIGRDAPDWLQKRAYQDRQIILKGFVENVRAEISRAEVCICPIFSGSGTRLKILEYMAIGRPVVSSTMGVQGLDVSNNRNILLADNPKDFSESIARLFENSIKRKSIASAGRLLVGMNYRWKDIGKSLENFYKKI